MMKDRVFGHGTTTSMLGSPGHSGAEKKKKSADEGNNRVDLRGTEGVFHGEEQTHKSELWSEENTQRNTR